MNKNELPTADGSQELQDQMNEPNSSEYESSSNSAPTQPMSEAERAAAISDLLASDQEDENPPSEGDPPEDEPDALGDDTATPEQGLSPASIAEKLGLEPKDVYDMEIPTGDGETTTLGALKDAWGQRQQAERETAQRISDLNERESRIISDQQIWSVLAQQGRVPQAEMQRAAQVIQQRLQHETDTLLSLVPEFNDNDKREQFRRDAVRVLGDVGFAPHEVNMADHRHALFVRKFVQMENDLKNAKAEVKRLTKKEPPKTVKSNGRPLAAGRVNVRAAAKGSESQKVDAVSKLIGG